MTQDVNLVDGNYGDLSETRDSDRQSLLTEQIVEYKRPPNRVSECQLWIRVREILSGCTAAVFSIVVVLVVLIWQQPSLDFSPNLLAGRCPVGQIADCNGNCIEQDWVGDGYCDDSNTVTLNCQFHNLDGGDCDPNRDCGENRVRSSWQSECSWLMLIVFRAYSTVTNFFALSVAAGLPQQLRASRLGW